jgi:hypothetical protein
MFAVARPLLGIAVLLAASGLGRCEPELDEKQQLYKRSECNADNLLRLMRGSQHLTDSQQFCTSYICAQPPTTTSTVYYVRHWEYCGL